MFLTPSEIGCSSEAICYLHSGGMDSFGMMVLFRNFDRTNQNIYWISHRIWIVDGRHESGSIVEGSNELFGHFQNVCIFGMRHGCGQQPAKRHRTESQTAIARYGLEAFQHWIHSIRWISSHRGDAVCVCAHAQPKPHKQCPIHCGIPNAIQHFWLTWFRNCHRLTLGNAWICIEIDFNKNSQRENIACALQSIIRRHNFM